MYIQDQKFYTYVLQNLEAPFHFKLEVKPKPPYGGDAVSNDFLKLDAVQTNAVRILLNSFGARDLKEYPKNGPKHEALLLYFTFENRKEAKAFQDFIGDRSKY